MQTLSWAGPTPAKANIAGLPAGLPVKEFVFYGASRVEAPKVGLKFRRTGSTFQVLGVRAERTRSREFGRSWKFVTECQTMPLWGN